MHGDLKPGNLLIFAGVDRLVVKLTDFGLSVAGEGGIDGPARLGGTRGWQALELETGQLLMPSDLLKTDIYSFGLVLWSTILESCQSPPSREVDDVKQISSGLQLTGNNGKVDPQVLSNLEQTLPQLLHRDPAKRPLKLGPLFDADVGDTSRGTG